MSVSLIIQTSFLGDTVLTTPLIAELAARGSVDVVVTPPAAPLLANNPHIRELFVYDKRGADRGVGGLMRTARRMHARWRARGDPTAPDSAYLAQASMRSAILAWLSGARSRVGFADAPGRALYTRRVRQREGDHHVARLLSLAYADPARELSDGPPPIRLYPSDDDRRAVDAILATQPSDRSLAVLAPGSVRATKRWPYYPELAQRLAPRYRIAVIGSAADSAEGRAIAQTAGSGVIDATGQLSILASAELIRRACVLVSNDSLPQHLASAMGTPTVTLFGPTVPEFGFGPLAPHSVSLGVRPLACRPCSHNGPRVCPLGHWRCMRDLDVDRVENAVASIAASRGA